MDIKDRFRLSFMCYAILMVLAYLSFGSVLVYTGKRIEANTMQGTAYVK